MASGGYQKGTLSAALLRINSSNRLPGGLNSQFKIDLGSNLQTVTGISIISCQFYNVFYNVYNNQYHSNNNVSFSIDDGKAVTTYNTQWEPGFYSVEDFLFTFTNYLLTKGITLVWDINPITNKVSFYTDTVGSTLTLLPGSTLFPEQRLLDEYLYHMVGFDVPSTGLLISNTGVTPTIAANLPYMNHTSVVYISSSTLAPKNSFDESGKTSNILLGMDVDVPWLSLQTWSCKVDLLCEVQYVRTRPLNQIDIQLVDHEGYPVDLGNTEFNLDLKVWFNNN